MNAWEQYANWVQDLHTFMPDAGYGIKSFATDEKRKAVCAYAVFSATHTGEGGPCPPTENSTSTDYVYVIEFDGDHMIRHMTKMGHSWMSMKVLDWGT